MHMSQKCSLNLEARRKNIGLCQSYIRVLCLGNLLCSRWIAVLQFLFVSTSVAAGRMMGGSRCVTRRSGASLCSWLPGQHMLSAVTIDRSVLAAQSLPRNSMLPHMSFDTRDAGSTVSWNTSCPRTKVALTLPISCVSRKAVVVLCLWKHPAELVSASGLRVPHLTEATG